MIDQINCQADLDAAAQALKTTAPAFAPILAQTGPLPLRRYEGGFAGILRILVGQQVSTASADAIWARLQEAGMQDPAAWDAATDADLVACGLSKPKMRYGRALVAARVDYAALNGQSDTQVFEHLTAITGIGPWTAQIYLMSALGRMDVFPAADLALQEAAKIMLDLPERPKAAHMTDIAADWAPYRSVAARALWAYYRLQKGRKGTL